MSTYNGWNVVSIPTTPPSPASIEFSVVDAVSLSVSPFTGQQQIYDWNASWMEASVTMPPMTDADVQAWIAFLVALKGVACVFQFSTEFAAAYPASLTSGSPPGQRYWRLKSNARKWSITPDRFYLLQFELREAL